MKTTIQKPKSLSIEDFEIMEKIAKIFKEYRIQDLNDLLLEDGEFTIPGELASRSATKKQFLTYFKFELGFYKKIFEDKIEHSYSVCDQCVFGHTVLRFNKCFSREAFLGSNGIAFRIKTKNEKVSLMEVCFSDIENSFIQENRAGLNSNNSDQNDFQDYKKKELPENDPYLAACMIYSTLEGALKHFLLENFDLFRKNVAAFNWLTRTHIIEGMYTNSAVNEILGNPEILEAERDEIIERLEFWVTIYAEKKETYNLNGDWL